MRSEHIYSSSMGDLMQTPKHIAHQSDSAFYTKAKQRNILNWFAEQVLYYRNFSLAGGLQGAYSNDFGHFLCYSLDATYSLSNALQIAASSNSSLRLPTFTDLNYEDPVHKGNAALRPEQATTYEAGLKYLHQNFKGQASIFYRQGKNIIDWAKDATGQYVSRNLMINTLGATLSGAYTPPNYIKQWLAGARLDYTYLYVPNNDDGYASRILNNLNHKVTFTAIHPLPFGLGFSWSLIHERRNGQYDAGSTPPAFLNFAPVTLVNAKLFWNAKNLQLYLDANNLFDHTYFDFALLEQPGRWIKAGLIIKI
jgi:iron complex outermembrane receptor protein